MHFCDHVLVQVKCSYWWHK